MNYYLKLFIRFSTDLGTVLEVAGSNDCDFMTSFFCNLVFFDSNKVINNKNDSDAAEICTIIIGIILAFCSLLSGFYLLK